MSKLALQIVLSVLMWMFALACVGERQGGAKTLYALVTVAGMILLLVSLVL